MIRTEHGGNTLGMEGILDFSANINPLGITENIRRAFILSADELDRYPDPFCVKLRKKIGGHIGKEMERIVCGNGADELIYRIVNAVRPRRALIVSPTFSEYGKALAESGCETEEYILKEENGFEVTEDLLHCIKDEYDMFFLCSPNNPTGRAVREDILAYSADICRRNGIILVCDESFIHYTDSRGMIPFLNENVIVLRSMTKSWAVPGIRLGYAVFGSKEMADRAGRTGQFWSVSAPAQRIGEAAADDMKYLERSAEYVKRERRYLNSGLAGLVEKVYPSDVNFILFRAEADMDEKMLEQGILIRNCSDFSGLSEGFFRIAVRTREENEILINTLRRLRNG